MTQTTNTTPTPVNDGISRCEHCGTIVEAHHLHTVGVFRLCQDCAWDDEIRAQYR